MQIKRFTIPLLAALTGLSACGDTIAQQGLIGAGAGAGTALVLGGSVGTGLVVGAAGNVAYCQATKRC
ncbi:hypothetical protein ROA7450_02580 [Roseovarius albus]|uniref:Lipoprotein n=1 Tax=Roseovarius albus TaxID=1247867 RepID=A0A1X6ZHC0_9RHOB|nr:hypothetical protein [Roseovarius albus]SLN51496.1 hypothetical protein ROA7450_02580 [Roseovarius albus]